MTKRIFSLLLVVALSLLLTAQWAGAQGDVPAYNAKPPRKGSKLPPILPKERRLGPYFNHPAQLRAYELAEQVSDVLYQQPCYCYCDRSLHHASLRTCFESTHGAACSTCMKEVFYTYLQHKKGKKAAEIRQEIIAGKWKDIDLQHAASIK